MLSNIYLFMFTKIIPGLVKPGILFGKYRVELRETVSRALPVSAKACKHPLFAAYTQ